MTEKNTKVMTSAEIIRNFREEMSEADWYRFCLRYAGRSIKTPVSIIADNYGKLPYGFAKDFSSVLQENADRVRNLELEENIDSLYKKSAKQ